MFIKKLKMLLVCSIAFTFIISCQDKPRDIGEFKEKQKGFYDNVIMKDAEKDEEDEKESKKIFTAKLDNFNPPKSVDEFTTQWHNPPISQGNTGMCWAFSTGSFFESEVYRLQKLEVGLSEIWTAYWEYVEKAQEYIRTKGESLFAQGSEANAVTRIWKKYGIVPRECYTGLAEGQEFHNHKKLFTEMKEYLESIKKKENWNEEKSIAKIKSILNKHLGTPPTMVEDGDSELTPKEYLTNYLKLNLDDYVDILSYMQQPYYEQVEYEVEDNWWHSKEYYNVPLDEFMKALNGALKNGYSMSIGGDVSEPGKNAAADVFVIPTFDIPSDYIDEYSRQFRFSNETTTDDHGIHMVGYTNRDGVNWYLIKDSGASSRDGNNKGYYFLHQDYVKLKMMDFMVHKDAVTELLKKF
jgi:bleomycin hydrolase